MKLVAQAKDLTKELYFAENRLTTAEEIKSLAIELLNTTWTIDLYRFQDAKVINLLDLGWCFEFNDRKRAAGLCSLRNKTIYISQWLFSQNPDKSLEFENTLRHEVAHAIDFEIRKTSNHDKVWKFIARTILCDGERCYSNKVIQTKVKTKYTLVCVEEGCDYTRPSHKARPKNAISQPCCTNCYNAGKGYKVLKQIQNF